MIHYLDVEEWDERENPCWTLVHPPECPTNRDGGQWINCLEGHVADSENLRDCFRHADDPDPRDNGLPSVKPGLHRVEGWHRQRIAAGSWGGPEWEMGMEVLSDG